MKGGGKGTKKGDVLQQKSPAEFFAENKNIAGFDNVSRDHFRDGFDPLLRLCDITVLCPCSSQPGKCLYTTIRELVENSLDSAESMNQLPNIEITV